MTVTLTARTAEVVLYQGDDRAKIQHLADRVSAAETKRRAAANQAQLLAGDDLNAEVVATVEEYNAAVETGKSRALVASLTAVDYRSWRALKKSHPPRDGEDEDKLIGQNWDTFPRAAILACWQDESVPNRAEQLEALCEADFLLLFATAQRLNTSQGFDPKAATASDVMLVNAGM